jgi:hypothetical protein
VKRCPKCGKTFADEANFCPTDAGRLVVVATDAIAAQAIVGSSLVGARFELGPVIGGSHTGEVHRATDTTTHAHVAVKLVAPGVLSIPQVAQRIERELKQLERVNHRGVAKVLASGKHGDRVFVATELIDGARSLGDLIAASGPVDAQRASELVLAIGEALIEAAKVGVVHRDLAPKNILVTPDSLRLINFAVPTPGDKVAGVIEFVAPEAIEGKPVDQRSNIYSLGAIYYFLLTGRAPHIGEPASVSQAHLAGGVEPPSRHGDVPTDVDAKVVRALERNAAKRYLTLRQFLDEVEGLTRGPEGGTGATAPFGRAGKPKELSQTLMGFGFGGPGGAQKSVDAMTAQKTTPMDAPVVPRPSLEPAAPPVMVAAPVAEPAQVSAGATAADGSPWGRPADAPGPAHFAPAAAAVQQAAPAIGAVAAAAAPAAPAPASPKVAAAPTGKKKDEKKEKDKGKDKGGKGKFRETMWFKKGELDAQAAEEAAATGDANAAGKADLMPIEERYNDDGTINRSDADKYSLKTGATSMMHAMRDTSPSQSVSERELVGEMKGGRNVIIIVIAVAVVALAAIAIAFAL